MARPLRVDAPGVVVHVIVRGNARELVFVDDRDRRVFLDLLARVVERLGWLLYAYCLMGNHYHLVLETPQGRLSRGMGQLNGQFARSFNRRYGRCGHVFQARFRSILVEEDSYLLAVCRYAVLNPVRARLCPGPGAWLWSSYRATAGIDAAPALLASDRLLAWFAPDRGRAQVLYRRFVAEGLAERLEEQAVGERLGGIEFLRRRIPAPAEVPRVQVQPVPPSLEELFGSADPTPVATAYREHGYTLREIAEHLGCHYSTISRQLRRQETTPAATRSERAP